MVAPVLAMSDRLRVTSGMSAAMDCAAISMSNSAMGRPSALNRALVCPNIAAVLRSTANILPSQRVVRSSMKARSCLLRGSSDNFASPYSISATTIEDKYSSLQRASMNATTASLGCLRSSSLQTFVSISTERLTVRVNRSFTGKGISVKTGPGNGDKMTYKLFAAHRPNFGCTIIRSRRISPFEQRAQFGFERATVLRSGQSCALFDRVVDVSDGHTSHRQSPLIAMQSMYAMRAI